MKIKNLQQRGFHVVEVLIIIIAIGVVGFVGYKIFSGGEESKNGQSDSAKSGSGSMPVTWAFNEQTHEWFAQDGKPTACKNPFKFDRTPIDISKATSIMMPGAYRGFSYKPHGGFRLDTSSDGHIDVKLPIDATLVGLTRYYEGNPSSLQYLLTFETDCGIAFRFDHLYTLTPKFQAIAETRPEPKKDDTRSDPNNQPKPTRFKSGEVVATAVGFPANKNFGFDFGVYDYRKRNTISKNTAWVKNHNTYPSLEWFGVCWFNMLPGSDAAKAETLSEVVVNPQKPNIVSDYCSNATYETLDFNGGKPTDG